MKRDVFSVKKDTAGALPTLLARVIPPGNAIGGRLVGTVLLFAMLGCASTPFPPGDAATGTDSTHDAPTIENRLGSAERAAGRALRAERAVRGARAMFAEDEAEILVAARGIRVRFLVPLFENDSSRLAPSAFDQLGRLRATIELFSAPRIVIHAPAGTEGSQEALLAQIRANRLRRVLVHARAVPETRAFPRLEPTSRSNFEVSIETEGGFDGVAPRPADVSRL